MREGAVLAIDPGREKIGLAVLTPSAVHERQIVLTADLTAAVARLLGRHAIDVVVVGDRTGSGDVRRLLLRTFPGFRIVAVEEEGTTLEARRLYFVDHPRRGWRRLVPLSLQTPPEPYDDYAAAVLGRRYITRRASGKFDGISRKGEE